MTRDDKRSPIRFARFRAGGKTAYGTVEGNRIRTVTGDPFGTWEPTETTHAVAEVELLVPVVPTKVLAVGINYRSHVGTRPTPKVPEIFYKSLPSLIAHGAEIVIPPGTNDVHYEGEMVIVMGRQAKNVSEADAPAHVLGVTCGNDVSARDWQQGDRQWWRAKGSDTFGPCGPFLATNVDYNDLALELRHNGEVKQSQRTSDLIFPVATIVSWISRHVTLEPGDLIFSGTPGTTSPIKPGDVIEVEIEGVGTLRNGVAGA